MASGGQPHGPDRDGVSAYTLPAGGGQVEDEDECRRKLCEKRIKIQKELREVERLSFASKDMQENLMESMQHKLQEVEKRRNDLMPEHQKV